MTTKPKSSYFSLTRSGDMSGLVPCNKEEADMRIFVHSRHAVAEV